MTEHDKELRMILDEEAAISYKPDDNVGIQVALDEAERQLTHCKGVKGMGMAKTPAGEDAIVVYVQDQQALSQLPAVVGGFPVVGEITGEIRAL
jgi:hypothetical protein